MTAISSELAPTYVDELSVYIGTNPEGLAVIEMFVKEKHT
jgi:hypothetical protein